jgi:hypothetical protein
VIDTRSGDIPTLANRVPEKNVSGEAMPELTKVVLNATPSPNNVLPAKLEISVAVGGQPLFPPGKYTKLIKLGAHCKKS